MTLLPTTAVWMNLTEYGATGTMFLCAALLWCRRHENRKQRILQAAAFVMGGAWLLSHLLTTCKAGMPESYPLLPVLPLYGGCWFLLFLLLYPAEAIRPGWSGWRNAWLLFLPVIVLSVFLLPYPVLRFCVPYHWRQSSVDAKWIRAYASAVQGVGVSYLLFMATGTLVSCAIFLTCCTLFSVYAAYQELYVRLVPRRCADTAGKEKKTFC